MSRKQQGIGFREMLVIMIALGLLSAVVVPQFSNAGVAVREEQINNEQRLVQAAIDLYRAQHGELRPAGQDRGVD